jgi:hypothetical protein
MDNIFEIRFSFEQKTKDEVIYKFSTNKVETITFFLSIGNVSYGQQSLDSSETRKDH